MLLPSQPCPGCLLSHSPEAAFYRLCNFVEQEAGGSLLPATRWESLEHWGCQACAGLPPWITEDARYVSSGGAELCTHCAAPAGFPSWDPTLYILDTTQVVRLEGT